MLEGLVEDSLFRQRLTGHFPHLTGTYARRTKCESGWGKKPQVQLYSSVPCLLFLKAVSTQTFPLCCLACWFFWESLWQRSTQLPLSSLEVPSLVCVKAGTQLFVDKSISKANQFWQSTNSFACKSAVSLFFCELLLLILLPTASCPGTFIMIAFTV